MQEHFRFTIDQAKIQKQYAAAQLSCIQIYLQRRNRHLLKQEDEVIIVIHVLGKLLTSDGDKAAQTPFSYFIFSISSIGSSVKS
jgi:hypothetical protein